MANSEASDRPSPYESPREQGYYAHRSFEFWPWLKDRLLLLGWGFILFIPAWSIVTIMFVVIARLFGYKVY